jgi:hypothetical protein
MTLSPLAMSKSRTFATTSCIRVHIRSRSEFSSESELATSQVKTLSTKAGPLSKLAPRFPKQLPMK